MQLMDGSLESQSVGWKVDKYIYLFIHLYFFPQKIFFKLK